MRNSNFVTPGDVRMLQRLTLRRHIRIASPFRDLLNELTKIVDDSVPEKKGGDKDVQLSRETEDGDVSEGQVHHAEKSSVNCSRLFQRPVEIALQEHNLHQRSLKFPCDTTALVNWWMIEIRKPCHHEKKQIAKLKDMELWKKVHTIQYNFFISGYKLRDMRSPDPFSKAIIKHGDLRMFDIFYRRYMPLPIKHSWWTVHLYFCVKYNRRDLIDHLIHNPINGSTNRASDKMWLMNLIGRYAAYFGRIDLILYARDSGFDPCSYDANRMAAQGGSTEVLELFPSSLPREDFCLHANAEGRKGVQISYDTIHNTVQNMGTAFASFNDAESMDCLNQLQSLDLSSSNMKQILHMACSTGKKALILHLLNNGETSLHLVKSGDHDLFEWFHKEKFDMHPHCIHAAVASGHPLMVRHIHLHLGQPLGEELFTVAARRHDVMMMEVLDEMRCPMDLLECFRTASDMIEMRETREKRWTHDCSNIDHKCATLRWLLLKKKGWKEEQVGDRCRDQEEITQHFYGEDLPLYTNLRRKKSFWNKLLGK
ncbi:hypothetical protein PROFUN_08512 [Planoprotostelium fungivorum]|uniref:Uncharacterized protein n=1 Tax=Planoprotostelium fungivorum TaxID=1890364 RepID=A0A2P6NJB6_9EUKA|nr:hypothetical protein PROFUN_08512 [Planoprotostelium fungivorum]